MQRFRRKNGQKGFTMIELMVVVVIVGVLAGIAIPIYGRYIRNARITEAPGRIGEIITAAKAYAQEHQDGAGIAQWPPNAGGGIVDLSDSDLFSYALTGGDAPATGALTVTATGIAGKKMAGVTVAITVASITATGGAPVIANL